MKKVAAVVLQKFDVVLRPTGCSPSRFEHLDAVLASYRLRCLKEAASHHGWRQGYLEIRYHSQPYERINVVPNRENPVRSIKELNSRMPTKECPNRIGSQFKRTTNKINTCKENIHKLSEKNVITDLPQE